MSNMKTHAMTILVLIVFLAWNPGAAVAELICKGKSISIRFPAFSLSPGERISGITVKTSLGRLSNSCLPSRWTCEHKGKTIHCFSLHQNYATAMTGKLPEIFIRDLPADGRQLSIEASVEFLSGDGREYTRSFSESELIIQ